jgi:hypothetical protein
VYRSPVDEVAVVDCCEVVCLEVDARDPAWEREAECDVLAREGATDGAREGAISINPSSQEFRVEDDPRGSKVGWGEWWSG